MQVFRPLRSSGCSGCRALTVVVCEGVPPGLGSLKGRSLKTVIESVVVLGPLDGRHGTKWVNRSQDNTKIIAGSSRILICSEESWSSAVLGFLFPSFSHVWPRE